MELKDLEDKYSPQFEFGNEDKRYFATDGSSLFSTPSIEQLEQLIRKHNESRHNR